MILKLDIIKYNEKVSYKFINLSKNDPYIGTIDLETYYDVKGISCYGL